MKKTFNQVSTFIKQNYLFFLLFFLVANSFNYIFPELNTFTTAGFIYRGTILFLYITFALFVSFNSQIIKNKYFIIILSIYFLFATGSVVNVSFNPLTSSTPIDSTYYLKAFGQIFVNAISIIVLLSIPKSENRNNILTCYIILGIVAFAIIFSLIKDYKSIVNTLVETDHSNYDVTSFFVDKNTFGLLLFIGSVISYYLCKNKNYLYILPTFLILLYSLLARCKTAAVLILAIVLLSFIELLISLFKKNKKTFVVTVVSVSAVLLVTLILVLTRVWIFKYIYSALFDKYGLIYDSRVVILDRFDNWQNALRKLSTFAFATLGYSERIYQLFIANPVDNIFILTLVTGGAIKFILYLIFLAYLIKENAKNRNVMILLGLFMLYGLMQDYTIVGVSFSSLGFTILYLIYRNTNCFDRSL